MSGTSDFDIEIEDFVSAAPAFTTAGDEISDTLKQVGPALEALGDFWGSNAGGPKFGESYQKALTLLLEVGGFAGTELQGMGDGLARMARDYQITEDANVDHFRGHE